MILDASLRRIAYSDRDFLVAVEPEELDRRAEDFRGPLRLGGAPGRRAVGAGLAARANDQVHRPARAGFAGDQAAAAELDVVGVRAKGEEG